MCHRYLNKDIISERLKDNYLNNWHANMILSNYLILLSRGVECNIVLQTYSLLEPVKNRYRIVNPSGVLFLQGNNVFS